MMGNGAYGWQMMAPGVYRGPMAYMAPTSMRQFTLVCTDPNSGTRTSWQIGSRRPTVEADAASIGSLKHRRGMCYNWS